MKPKSIWGPAGAALLVSLLLLPGATSRTLAQRIGADPPEVGVDEKLGQHIPLDLEVHGIEGDTLRLADLIDKPTVLTLVYYRCPGVCPAILSGVLDVVEKLDIPLGESYQVLSVSFDPLEKPDLARRARATIQSQAHAPIADEAWRFVTADSTTIAALTDAVGFHFQRVGKDFTHPAVLTVLSPEGRIARYLYGVSYLPFDLKLALVEAAEERWGPSINRVLLYCFSYDPEGQTYVFNILKVTGTVIMVLAAGFAGFLVLAGRRQRKES